MATQTISYQSLTWLPVVPCKQVKLCLKDVWADRTEDGTAFVTATVGESIRELGCSSFLSKFKFNNRQVGKIQYTFHIDDTQISDNVATGAPWVVSCDDIVEVFPYACTADKTINLPVEEAPPEGGE